MKKLLLTACAVLVLAGCGSSTKDDAKKMTCKMSQEANGITVETSIDFTYSGNNISRQDQKVVMTAQDEKTYEAMKPMVEGASLESRAKGVEGFKYELTFDDKKFTVNEHMDFDLNAMSPKDYGSFTNQNLEGDSLKGLVKLDKTKENMEKSGLTCTE